MSLEPTEEQWRALLAHLYPDEKPGVTYGLDSPTADNLLEQAAETWDLIRDMVLEAAAAKLEEDYTSNTGVPWPGSMGFVKRIRAMKGTP